MAYVHVCWNCNHLTWMHTFLIVAAFVVLIVIGVVLVWVFAYEEVINSWDKLKSLFSPEEKPASSASLVVAPPPSSSSSLVGTPCSFLPFPSMGDGVYMLNMGWPKTFCEVVNGWHGITTNMPFSNTDKVYADFDAIMQGTNRHVKFVEHKFDKQSYHEGHNGLYIETLPAYSDLYVESMFYAPESKDYNIKVIVAGGMTLRVDGKMETMVEINDRGQTLQKQSKIGVVFNEGNRRFKSHVYLKKGVHSFSILYGCRMSSGVSLSIDDGGFYISTGGVLINGESKQ